MRKLKGSLSIIFSFLFILFFGFNVNAKEISISDLNVNSIVLKDGSLNIQETINFKMQGEYNGVYRDIDTKFSGGVSNIQVKEISNSGEIELKQVEKGKDGQNGIYEVSQSGQIYKLKIYSPSKDENKKFKISYTLKNVAKKYSDIGELRYRFWGDASETTVDKFNINVSLENKAEDNAVKIFAKGPIEENIQASIIDSNNFNIKGGKIEKKTPVEGRFLFKKEAIVLSNNISNENALEKIINEENAYKKSVEEEKLKKEKLKSIGEIISSGVVVLNLILGIAILKTNRRKLEEFNYEFFPEECTPAIAGRLYRNVIDEKSLIATLLDLVRRKYLDITILDDDIYIVRNDKKTHKELLLHESFLIKWFMNYIGDGEKVKSKRIEKYSKNNKKKFYDEFSKWRDLVKEEFNKKGYYDNKTKKLWSSFLVVFMIELGVSAIFLAEGSMTAMIGLLTTVSVMIYSFSLKNKKSIYGETQFKKWKSFKEYLIKNNEIKEGLTSLNDVDKYLVYGIALGVNSEIFDEININIKNTSESYNDYDNSCLYWYYGLSMDEDDNPIKQSIDNSSNNYGGGDSGNSYSGGDSGGCSGGGDAGGF